MPSLPSQINSGYQPQAEDTSIEADLLIFQLLRKLTPQEKITRFCNFNQALRNLAVIGIKNQYPENYLSQLREEFIKRQLGQDWLKILEILEINKIQDQLVIEDPLMLAQKIADILEKLNIPYLIGGSVASSLLGETRATQDLDLVIDLTPPQAEQLIATMTGKFYISETAVYEAITHKSSFNIIDLTSIEKADIFILNNDPFSQGKMKRRKFYQINLDLEQGIYIYSPEDIILQKLRWYNLSQTESQKQWRDILGVLKIQRENLDFNYLYTWAKKLQLTELLQKSLKQAGL